MCIVLYIKFNISQQRFSNRKGPLRASGPHTNKKNCERQFLSPQFFTGFSAKSIFHGSLQLHHTIPEYMCLHHFYFCSLVNYNEIFSLYFECTLSTKISHPQDKNKWHQLVSKKLTLHEICQVQCSHLPTNENLFQSRSFRNVDMPPKR